MNEYKAIVLNDYPMGKHYATLVEQEIKTVETRMKMFSYRGDLVICCGNKSVTANAGKALCIVNLFDARPMEDNDEEAACICNTEGRIVHLLNNWRWFSRKFSFTRRRVSGTYQGIFTISIPDDVSIVNYNPNKKAMRGTWRSAAQPIIAQVIKDMDGKSEKEIRSALRDAYPWGERAMFPYKVWCDEVKIQLGKKRRKRLEMSKNQTKMF